MKTALTFAIALTLAGFAAASNAATYVYRKPVAGTQCAGSACDIKAGPTVAAEPSAFDPTIVIGQARYMARAFGIGNTMYFVPQPSAAPDQSWYGSVTMVTPNRYAAVTRTLNIANGQYTYNVVMLPDDSEQTRQTLGNLYVDATGQWTGSQRIQATTFVTPEACAAVAAAAQADVTCYGGVLVSTFIRPETPVDLANTGPWAVFGGYQLQNAAAYQAAEFDWKPWNMGWAYPEGD